jgi:hypothetical protein
VSATTTDTDRTGGDGQATPADRSAFRLATYFGGLVLMLVAGYGLGRAVGVASPTAGGPIGDTRGAPTGHAHAPGTLPDHPHFGATIGDTTVGGLAVSAGGYTLIAASTTMRAGVPAPFSFRIDGPDRRPVTTFAIAHGKPMHLIVVRRDLSGYQHLHPAMATDGTWQLDLTLPAPGTWRAYADFAALDATGAKVAVALGVDLTVAGEFAPTPIPSAARESTVDGYTVAYEGTPQTGAVRPLVFRVSRSGEPVVNLERYLGAYGHLVVLREGDLGYVHVHPEDRLFLGATKFWLAPPSPGRYGMFFEFQVGATVHTAAYTMVVS